MIKLRKEMRLFTDVEKIFTSSQGIIKAAKPIHIAVVPDTNDKIISIYTLQGEFQYNCTTKQVVQINNYFFTEDCAIVPGYTYRILNYVDNIQLYVSVDYQSNIKVAEQFTPIFNYPEYSFTAGIMFKNRCIFAYCHRANTKDTPNYNECIISFDCTQPTQPSDYKCQHSINANKFYISKVDQKLYAWNDSGMNLWVSTDGINFTLLHTFNVSSGGSRGIRCVKQFSNGNLFVGLYGYNNCFYISTDNGVTFVNATVNVSFTDKYLTRASVIELDGTVYAYIGGTKMTIVKSLDYGITWQYVKDREDGVLDGNWYNVDSNTVLIQTANSVGLTQNILGKYTREKYLDQNGAQALVTLFQAYCNSLVGGA